MLNDTVDIIDAYIVNIGINFEIVANQTKNRFEVLEAALAALREKFATHNYIGEPFYINDIYSTLNRVEGVVDVVRVKVEQKKGSDYSSTHYDIQGNTSADGRYINVPSNVILEVKFLQNDIKGSVK